MMRGKKATVLYTILAVIVGMLTMPTVAQACAARPNPVATPIERGYATKRTHAWFNAHPNTRPTPARYQCLWRFYVRELRISCMSRPVVNGVRVKRVRASLHQRRMITRVLNVGRKRKAKPKVMVASIATITQESTATNLAGGHGTSVGLFQIINTHGRAEQRRNPEWAADWFFDRAINVNHHKPWLSTGQLAQEVQRSAHPTAYNQWVSEATRTYKKYLGICAGVHYA